MKTGMVMYWDLWLCITLRWDTAEVTEHSPAQYPTVRRSRLCSTFRTGFNVSTKKLRTTWELWVKFYWGQNEDCSSGGSISDSSDRLLKSRSGGQSIYKVLMKGAFKTTKHSFYKRVCVSHEDLMSPRRHLVLL